MREATGQAAVEYVALIAIVAVLMVASIGLTQGGIGGRVLIGMQRGLCVVAPIPCPSDPETTADELAPCEMSTDERDEQLTETIMSVKLGTSGRLTAVRTSDGKVKVTLTDGSTEGFEGELGPRIGLGAESVGAGLVGGGGVTWSSGRTWTFPDEAAAKQFIRRYGDKATIGGKLVDDVRSVCSLLCDAIGWRPHPELPTPDVEHVEGGAFATLDAELGVGATADGDARAQAVLGRDRQRDGTTTWFLRLDGDAVASLNLPSGGGPREQAQGEGVLAVTVDPDGTPRSLSVTAKRGTTGGTSAGLTAAGAIGTAEGEGESTAHARAGSAGGTLTEVSAQLDLRDPGNLAVATDLLDAFAHPDRIPGRAAALGARFATNGQLDTRTYALDDSRSDIGASLGAGLEVGADFGRTTKGLRLLSATTRLPGLPYLPRDDCRPT